MHKLALSLAISAVLTRGLTAQTTELVSLATGGAPIDFAADRSSISADGRFVAFDSWATTLTHAPANAWIDVFVRDRQTGTTQCVSVDGFGAPGNAASQWPSISADGRYVAFHSAATNLVPGDTNGVDDVFVRDLWSGATTRVSVDSFGAQANQASQRASISADGRRVAFDSSATNLVRFDTNGALDVFVHDMATSRTIRASTSSSGAQVIGTSGFPALSADGTRVAFSSDASTLVAPDTNGVRDAFVRDLVLSQTLNASVSSSGVQANETSDFLVSISADGRCVAFVSQATNLVSGATGLSTNVFVRDTSSGETSCATVNVLGKPVGLAAGTALSGDGRYIVFSSQAADLVAGDSNGVTDVFRRDRWLGVTTLLSVSSAGIQGNAASVAPFAITPDGDCTAFASSASNLVAGDSNGVRDVYVRDL